MLLCRRPLISHTSLSITKYSFPHLSFSLRKIPRHQKNSIAQTLFKNSSCCNLPILSLHNATSKYLSPWKDWPQVYNESVFNTLGLKKLSYLGKASWSCSLSQWRETGISRGNSVSKRCWTEPSAVPFYSLAAVEQAWAACLEYLLDRNF